MSFAKGNVTDTQEIKLASWKVSNLTEPAIQRGVAKIPMRGSVNVI